MDEMKEKKIRWNISKAMSSVYQSLNGSKLKIKKTKTYSQGKRILKTSKINTKQSIVFKNLKKH